MLCGFWFNSSDLRSAACNSWLLFLLQVGFFPGECVELINKNIPEALINSVPKPGTDVTFDGVGKQKGVFFGVVPCLIPPLFIAHCPLR